MKKSMYRFDNGQPEPVTRVMVGKDKLDVHREVNVIATCEAAARVRARRALLDDANGLPDSYQLVGVFALSADWQN